MSSRTQLPAVTFVIVSYAQAGVVGEAIEAALAQTYPNIDFIFSDDCSPDGTLDAMRAASAGHPREDRVQVRSTPRNLRLAGHVNDVMALVKTDFVCINAGDDVSEPDKVEKLMAPMLADPAVMGVHSAIREMSAEGELLGRRDCQWGASLTDLSFVIENSASSVIQSHACRAEVFSRFEPFDPELTQEGIATTARELMLGKIAYVPEPLTRYRLGGISTRSNLSSKERRIDEPLKVANWSLTALRQIRRDIAFAGISVAPELSERLDARIRYFEELVRLNREPLAIASLARILLRGEGIGMALRAFLRRNLPGALYDRLAS